MYCSENSETTIVKVDSTPTTANVHTARRSVISGKKKNVKHLGTISNIFLQPSKQFLELSKWLYYMKNDKSATDLYMEA